MYRVGVLSFSDGDPAAHELLKDEVKKFHQVLVDELKETGQVEVVEGEFITSNDKAKSEALKMAASGVDVTIFNYGVFCFPVLTAIAAQNGKGPFLLFSNYNPGNAAMVCLLASGGALDQLEINHLRFWGDLKNKQTRDRLMSMIRSAAVVNRLRGQTFGVFGGRSLGMYTAIPNMLQWQKQFGIDIEHVDELEIFRRAKNIGAGDVEGARNWLQNSLRRIHFDNNRLTPEKLDEQIRCYLATKQLVDERGFDFFGIKCHYEFSRQHVTQCLSAAFFNDPYDWQGEKKPVVCACEADADAALTMQILHLLTDMPVLFMDVRHYYPQDDVYVFCNCGSQSTWYANRSNSATENLPHVSLQPAIPLFAGGGAHVQYMCKEGPVTLARLARRGSTYRMSIIAAEFISQPEERMKETTFEWPHAFAKLPVDPQTLINCLGSNHIHAVAGNCVNELANTCKLLGIEVQILG